MFYNFVLSYDHPYILAGAGTVGLEIIDQVRDIDAIIVPTGGAGLLAGIANAVKPLFPEIKIIVSILSLYLFVQQEFL